MEASARPGDGTRGMIVEVGITPVRETGQAKRRKRTLQRKLLDGLRRCPHGSGAVRGAIAATSNGTREAAFESGAAPNTPIDAERLIDLLIDPNISAQKMPLQLRLLDAGALAEVAEKVEHEAAA